MKININNKEYEVIKNENDALDEEVLKEKLTDYFDEFDYILGDWAYGKLRLKGFNNKNNPNYKKINDYETIENYVKEYCAYGCKHFVLKKIANE